jgi:glycosyltransferase involved in cell wall biosynthesis
MTRFSIIVPVYNVKNEIRQCFESIKNQTFTDFEVLCVDDCGIDGSMDIVREFAQEDSRFKILTHEQNQGVSAARNTALKAVQGEYILFVDPDDWIELSTCEAINQAIINSNFADAIIYGYNNCSPDGTIDDHDYMEDSLINVTPKNINGFIGCVWHKAFKASLVKELKIDFPVGLIIEDTEFTFKFFSQIEKCYITKGIYYNYRIIRKGSYTTDDVTWNRVYDTFKIFERMIDFSREKGLFNKSRIAFLERFCSVIKGILINPNQKELVIELADKLLTKMDFPNSFKDLDTPKFMFWKN